MIEKTEHDISRYYGGTRPVNDLGRSDGRNLAQIGGSRG